MKTAELTGQLLDYWVAQAEGMLRMAGGTVEDKLGGYSPSTKWAHGGPLIERNLTGIYKTQYDGRPEYAWTARTPAGFDHRGPTPLIAAMRAVVACHFGIEVEEIEQ